MNVLLLGSGGREHALAMALARSPLCDRLYAAPGNPGIEEWAVCLSVDIADHDTVIRACREHAITFVVVGPEKPLVAGLVDDLALAGITAFGPGRAAAQLEGSKGYTKDLCAEAGIPTAAYHRFAEAAPARAHVEAMGAPIVVKADGLAAGKGVTVAATVEEALAAIDAIMAEPGASLVIEECLTGEEASFFALCDGEHAVALATAQDHKRVLDGDQGPNTGGMGAYSPAPVMTRALEKRVMRTIIRPTLAAMRARGAPFTGILYAGLMLTDDGPKLIEYNVRFGDPEAQVLIPRLKSDLLAAMLAASEGRLGSLALDWSDQAALCVVLAAAGYPGPPNRGGVIAGLAEAASLEDVFVFQAGTRREGERIVADGGRVLGVTALGPTIGAAQARAYEAVALIDWADGFCRRDIGWRAVAREKGAR